MTEDKGRILKNWDGSGDPLDVSAWLGTDDTL